VNGHVAWRQSSEEEAFCAGKVQPRAWWKSSIGDRRRIAVVDRVDPSESNGTLGSDRELGRMQRLYSLMRASDTGISSRQGENARSRIDPGQSPQSTAKVIKKDF